MYTFLINFIILVSFILLFYLGIIMISSYREQARDWKNLQIDDNTYMICLITENKSWKVLLTNLIEIWMETLTDETIFRKCQILNPLLNLKAFDWQELIMDTLNDIPKYIHTCTTEISVYQIQLQKTKDFIKLKFVLDLAKGSSQQFWENITMPLCSSSMELLRQHEILLDLVKRKDEEIAEYKAEGAELIRKYIATKPFNKALFHIDAATPDTTDFVKVFQSVFQFYNTMNLSNSYIKTELKISSNSTSNNISKIDGSILSELSESESVQISRQNDLNKNEQMHSQIEECEIIPSTSKGSILKLSNTSHKIQKNLQKNKKTLNDFIL